MEFSPTRRLMLALMGAGGAGLLTTSLFAQGALPTIAVSKDPNCGCCNGWVEHLRRAGFTVSVQDLADLSALKQRLGVPERLTSCHTAEVNGYVIEGHVPADAIQRLLREKPVAIGLAVPGMPVGSPGMEGGNPEIYDVVLFGKQGQTVFARYRESRAL